MRDIVVPIHETGRGEDALAQVIEQYQREPARIHLLNVRHPLPRHISRYFKNGGLHDFYLDAGMEVLVPAMKLLDDAGIPHQEHVLVGNEAETIVRFAEEHQCRQVILDREVSGSTSIFGLGSIASQVRHLMHADATADASPGASITT